MFAQSWYFSTMRKYVSYFGSLFATIHITRTLDTGEVTALVKVPLMYAKKEKALARLEQDPTLNRQTAITLPAMAFEMTGLVYDGARMLQKVNKTVVKNTDNKGRMKLQYVPAPYDLNFKLYVMVKNVEDGSKIIEQILPFFTPEWTATLDLIPEMNVIQDIPVVLNNITLEDTYTQDYSERRTLMWILDFTLKGYLYGPIKDKPIIRFANTEFFAIGGSAANNGIGTTDPFFRITEQPGLTANGAPTSNLSLTVDKSLIGVDDDWGVVEVRSDLIVE